jgi:hypothetical protein
VLGTVRFGYMRRDWSTTPMRSRQSWPACADPSEHRHLAGVARPVALEDLDGGVLPAPFGPSRPKTSPARSRSRSRAPPRRRRTTCAGRVTLIARRSPSSARAPRGRGRERRRGAPLSSAAISPQSGWWPTTTTAAPRPRRRRGGLRGRPGARRSSASGSQPSAGRAPPRSRARAAGARQHGVGPHAVGGEAGAQRPCGLPAGGRQRAQVVGLARCGLRVAYEVEAQRPRKSTVRPRPGWV